MEHSCAHARSNPKRTRTLRLVFAAGLMCQLASQAFLQGRATLRSSARKAHCAVRRAATMDDYDTSWDDPWEASRANINADDNWMLGEFEERQVRVTDIRDVNELLRLPNPMKPTKEIQLMAITLDDGTRIDRPAAEDLKKLRPSEIRPITFHWADRTQTQTKAPKQYDEIIQRLLNSGPAELEDLVRANWQQFDKGFFFRLLELKKDTTDERLKSKIVNLEQFAMKILEAGRNEMRKMLPQHGKDARAILDAMLEEDGALLWPPPPESYKRLAEAVNLRAVRAQHEDGWFETMMELVERFATKMDSQGKKELRQMGQIALQRIVTEWLRHDSLWEETAEGQFLFRLMSISDEQWKVQLAYENEPLDSFKLTEELKIISENRVVKLPMGSKLQKYAAKYLQGIVEFIQREKSHFQQSSTTTVEM